jgi:hypothetical protein
MAEKPRSETMASVRPSTMPGRASGIRTFSTICSGLAPNARAASIRPWSTSRIAPSMRRAMKGAAAIVSGTMAALVPIEVPAISLVNGMIATTRMMKGVERVALTMTPSTRLTQGAANSSPLPEVARKTPSGRPMIVAINAETATM